MVFIYNTRRVMFLASLKITAMATSVSFITHILACIWYH